MSPTCSHFPTAVMGSFLLSHCPPTPNRRLVSLVPPQLEPDTMSHQSFYSAVDKVPHPAYPAVDCLLTLTQWLCSKVRNRQAHSRSVDSPFGKSHLAHYRWR